jgi:hypothetical protein
MRYAILDAGNHVTNIAVADAAWQPGEGLTKREATAGCEIGGRWTGSGWEPPVVAVPVPAAITPLQARRALRAADLLDAVNAWIATQPDDAQEAWEYCIEIRRDDALIAGAQAALGLTAEQVDVLFRAAAELIT